MALLGCLTLASGYLASVASNSLATLGSACAQALREAVPPFQLNLSRYVFQVTICVCLNLIRREGVLIEQKLISPVLLAGLCSNIFNITYYTASALLPLGTLLVITNVAQIFNSCFLNKVIFNKTVPPLKFLFIAMMMLGLVLILQPYLIFHGVSIGAFGHTRRVEALGHDTDSNLTAPGVSFRVTGGSVTASVSKKLLGWVLAIVAGVASTSRGAIYKSKLPSVSMGALGFWIGILGVLPSTIFMFYIDDINLELSTHQVALLLGHGFGAAACSTLNIYAQQKLSPVTWAMMDNSKLVLHFILQYTILRSIQPGKMNALEVIGAMIANVAIVGCVVIDVKADRIKKEKEIIESDSEHSGSDSGGIELLKTDKKS